MGAGLIPELVAIVDFLPNQRESMRNELAPPITDSASVSSPSQPQQDSRYKGKSAIHPYTASSKSERIDADV